MLLAQAPPPPIAPPNPCREARRHLRCPDWVMAPPTDLHVRATPGGRTLLLMSNSLVNVGAGPVEFRGRRSGKREMNAEQVVERTGGRARVKLDTGAELYFKYVDARRGAYWKFADAARFELWRLDGAGRRLDRVRVGPKLDYCNRDLFRRRALPRSPRLAHYPGCNQRAALRTVTLGTSVGWADSYPSTYPQNWVEVTGQRGCFAILHRADPLNHVREEREDNNVAAKVVRLPFRHGPQRCPRYDGGAAPAEPAPS